MAFFNEDIATMLQYFTFPLKVIGLTLATIEVRFPETASRITADLLKNRAQMRSELEMGFWRALMTSPIVQATLAFFLCLVIAAALFTGNWKLLIIATGAALVLPLLLFQLTAMKRGLDFLVDWVPIAQWVPSVSSSRASAYWVKGINLWRSW